MFEFNGVEINEVAPVNVLDVIVSSPPVNVTTLDIPLRAGSQFVRSKIGTRMVTVPFLLMEDDEEKRRRHIVNIIEWATTEQECRLISTPEPEGYLMAACSQYPNQSSRDFWEVLTLVFTSSDPRYTACAENINSAGSYMFVDHKIPPKLTIRQMIDNTINNPAWRLGTEYVKISGSVTPGELVIDFEKESVMLNGQSISEQVTIDSTFFSLKKGANLIECENGAGGVAYWSERWV